MPWLWRIGAGSAAAAPEREVPQRGQAIRMAAAARAPTTLVRHSRRGRPLVSGSSSSSALRRGRRAARGVLRRAAPAAAVALSNKPNPPRTRAELLWAAAKVSAWAAPCGELLLMADCPREARMACGRAHTRCPGGPAHAGAGYLDASVHGAGRAGLASNGDSCAPADPAINLPLTLGHHRRWPNCITLCSYRYTQWRSCPCAWGQRRRTHRPARGALDGSRR